MTMAKWGQKKDPVDGLKTFAFLNLPSGQEVIFSIADKANKDRVGY